VQTVQTCRVYFGQTAKILVEYGFEELDPAYVHEEYHRRYVRNTAEETDEDSEESEE